MSRGIIIFGFPLFVLLAGCIKDAGDPNPHHAPIVIGGDYQCRGIVYEFPPSSPQLNMIKTGIVVNDSTIDFDWGDRGPQGYRMRITVQSNNHLLLSAAPGATAAPYTQMDLIPSGVPRWPKSDSCNNSYDPATKTFYIRCVLGSTFVFTEEILVKK